MWRVRICAVALAGVLLLAAAAAPAAAGAASSSDQITVTVPTHVEQRTVYDVTIHGFSSKSAIAYLFVDYAGCARSFVAERSRAPAESDFYAVRGTFAKVSGWKSSSAGSDHACAYLVGKTTGALLAQARVDFDVQG